MASDALRLVGGHDPFDESPGAAVRLIADRLQHLRKECGYRLEHVAKTAEGAPSASTIHRYEKANGDRKLTDESVLALISFYRPNDGELYDETVELLRRAHEARDLGTRWAPYKDVMGDQTPRLIESESTAKRIRTYEEGTVPGMLQTHAYAKAVMVAHRGRRRGDQARLAAEDKLRRRLELRRKRQDLLEEDDAPELTAIIHEQVLRSLTGGSAVMREQLHWLYSSAENKSRVHIRILPVESAATATAEHPSMTIFQKPEANAQPLVYLEERNRGGTYLTDPEDVDRYTQSMDEMYELAVSKKESLRMLAARLEELRGS